jgi:transcriptional regulator
MYAPNQFHEERRDVLLAAIRDIRLASIVSPSPEGLYATHAPVVVMEQGEELLLEFHVARPNPHWKLAGPGSLMIFQGPQAYVHPGWYAGKAEHGKVVPTWTYVVVHAHGPLEVFDGEQELRVHLEALTKQNEARRETPWAVSDAPENYIRSMMRGIVGLRMRVERIEGSWKLNQHKSEPDRLGVQAGLSGEGQPSSQSIAALMRAHEEARAADAARSHKVDQT